MKKNKLLVFVLLIFATIGCTSKEDKKPNIGIIQISEHESLDETRRGIIDGLKEKGYVDGENVTINYQNAQGDQANLKTISSSMAKKADLVIAIATPSAQAIMSEAPDIPIVFSVVTDPVKAGLVSDLTTPNANITGTSDRVDIAQQINLLASIKDNTKTIGLIYNSSEANSKAQIDDARAAIKKTGLKVKEVNVTTTNDIKQSMESLVNKVDAIYVGNDNTVAAGMSLVSSIAIEHKIPLVAASKEQVDNGALASYGIDHHLIGKETAFMAYDILNNNKTVKDIPIKVFTEYELYINKDTAKKIGIDPNTIKIEKK